jgi:glyoxylase-like metal-dependent hydrolase (beta-lactamase superfamily II)
MLRTFSGLLIFLLWAGAAQAEERGEGIRQFTVNDFTVYPIEDRETLMPAGLFSGPLSEKEKLAYMPGGQAPASVNVFLVRGSVGNWLIDAGWGRSDQGQEVLSGRLKQAGLSPDEIDLVILTHMHPDHIGGLLKGREPAFAKARVLLSRPELDYWAGLSRPKAVREAPAAAQESAAPEEGPADSESDRERPAGELPVAPSASADQPEDGFDQPPAVAPGDLPGAVIEAYGQRLATFDFGQEILPGLTALAAVGHTPGHTVFLMESGAEKLLFIGDLIHAAALQFPRPDESASYDQDPLKAVQSRKMILKMAAEEKIPVAGAHIPFPGTGSVSQDGSGGFAFAPITGKRN